MLLSESVVFNIVALSNLDLLLCKRILRWDKHHALPPENSFPDHAREVLAKEKLNITGVGHILYSLRG